MPRKLSKVYLAHGRVVDRTCGVCIARTALILFATEGESELYVRPRNRVSG